MSGVPRAVQEAFGCIGPSEKLQGGEGNAYLIGSAVFKPIQAVERYEWASQILASINPVGFKIAAPRKSSLGRFSHNSWGATNYEPGKHVYGRWQEKLNISRAFHAALSDLKPPPMPASDDRWSTAHRIAWQEAALPTDLHPAMRKSIELVIDKYRPVEEAPQIIHSDMCGNILFHDHASPLVIDFSPAYRPREYAEAILIADAIAWENATVELKTELPETPFYDQMFLRAINFRIIVMALFTPQNVANFEDEYRNFEPLLRLL